MQRLIDRVLASRLVFLVGGMTLFCATKFPSQMMAAVASSPDPVASTEPQYIIPQRVLESENILRFTFSGSDSSKLTFAEAMALLAASESNKAGVEFRHQMTEVLLGSSYEALFWECAPVSSASAASLPFEFVVLPSPELAHIGTGDFETFAEHMTSTCAAAEVGSADTVGNGSREDAIQAASVAAFSNLGGDAMLVSPCPLAHSPQTAATSKKEREREKGYPHLASFLRRAPPSQINGFWRVVGQVGARRLNLSAASSSVSSTETAQLSEEDDTPVWLSTSGLGVYWLHVRYDRRPKYYNYQPFKSFG